VTRPFRALLAPLALALSIVPALGQAAPPCSNLLAGVNERCPVWTGLYNHSGGSGGNREDVGLAVAVSPDSTKVFITGRSLDDTTGRDMATTAFAAASGTVLWSARYDAGAYDNGSAILATGDSVYVTGRSLEANGVNWDWATVAYDAATGTQRWARHVAGEEGIDDTSWSLAASPDGSTIYVGGTVDDGASQPGNALVMGYDTATGETRWTGLYDSGVYDGGLKVSVSPDGSTVYLAGGTRKGNDSMDFLAVAFEAEDPEHLGEVRWTTTHGSGQGHDTLTGAALSPDGRRLVVTGQSVGGTGNIDVHTAVFDTANGNKLWSAPYNGTRNASDTAAGVVVAGANAVVGMTGAEGAAGFDFVTRAYDLETGAVRWTAVENGTTNPATPDYLYAIAAAPSGGSVFVTGQSAVPRGEIQPIFKIEPATLNTYAYDAATGTRQWVARHNETGIGAGATVAITVSPDGQRVYPTGTFAFTGVYVYPTEAAKAYAWDMGVIAYPA
jgi:hypothetical protein